MTTTTQAVTVNKSVTVKADLEHAFNVFTEGFDTWWPRSHHIGKKPMVKAVIEPRKGGRCFGREADGTECQWGTVTAWEPPSRLVIAWHIAPDFQTTNLDPAVSSEVEVRFSKEANGLTRVDLEHRHLERHGKDFEKLRIGVAGPGGWSGLLQMFGRTANVYHPAVKPVAFIFATNDSLADRSFIGVKPEDLWKRPTPQTNSMLWVFAHMAAVRGRLLNLLGDNYDPGLGAFGRGAEVQDPATYPSRDQINEASREVNARLFAKLATLTEADLAREASGPLPPNVRTVADRLAFMAMHDSYHVGQLAYVRKALGLAGVVG
jgi:uncharacterized protein YndB with AHSA1/START domain/uncharacterized damage-inducible protein DinB